MCVDVQRRAWLIHVSSKVPEWKRRMKAVAFASEVEGRQEGLVDSERARTRREEIELGTDLRKMRKPCRLETRVDP